MKKKLKLKKKVWFFLILIIFVIIGITVGNKVYQKKQYQKTYEYKLLNHGYNEKETKIILNTFKDKNEREFFLKNKPNKLYLNILKEKYYKPSNFFQYIEYLEKNSNKELKEIIRIINTHRDKDFYELKIDTDISKDTLMLVNKYYSLNKEYIPEDLVYISQKYAWGEKNSKQIRKVCYDAFIEMWKKAKEDGYQLMINSAYRKPQEQEEIYNYYKENRGEKYADKIAARPGSSEHETGLALDIFSIKNSNKSTFEETDEAKWLEDNAYKYGFILRYPKDKKDITGYEYESWHYRYIGIDAATKCHNDDITFDEYYAYYVEK